MTPRPLSGALIAAALTASCSDGVDTGTSPTTVTFATEQFSAVIDPGGRRFYSFTLDTGGPVVVTLASVTHADAGAPLVAPLRIGVGRPQGTECPPATTVVVPAGLQSQLTHLAADGIHCIDVADPGTLTTPARFAVRFTHP